jgi:hypothetical protein
VKSLTCTWISCKMALMQRKIRASAADSTIGVWKCLWKSHCVAIWKAHGHTWGRKRCKSKFRIRRVYRWT